MKIDLTVKFSKTFCTTYKIVDGKLSVEKTILPPCIVCIEDNLLDRKVYNSARKAKYIPELVFRFLTRDEDTLDIDWSFYEKYLVGWYSLDDDMREFLTPTETKKLYEYMLNHMRDYPDSEGTLVLYFKLI